MLSDTPQYKDMIRENPGRRPTFIVYRRINATNAVAILGLSKGNRKERRIRRYMRAILAGDFNLGNQIIMIDWNGTLINGHNTLWALILADAEKPGVTIEVRIERNCDPLWARTVDTNAARTNDDVRVFKTGLLDMNAVDDSIIRLALSKNPGTVIPDLTVDEIDRVTRSIESDFNWVSQIFSKIPSGLKNSIVPAAWLRAKVSGVDQKLLEQAAAIYCEGKPPANCNVHPNPINELQRYFNRGKWGVNANKKKESWNKVVNALDKSVKNSNMLSLKSVNDAICDTFPLPQHIRDLIPDSDSTPALADLNLRLVGMAVKGMSRCKSGNGWTTTEIAAAIHSNGDLPDVKITSLSNRLNRLFKKMEIGNGVGYRTHCGHIQIASEGPNQRNRHYRFVPEARSHSEAG